VRLQPGLAMSKDGLSFEDRKGPILELGDADSWDKNGVSWPRVIPPKGTCDLGFSESWNPFALFDNVFGSSSLT
jgi:hypothetical protein